MCVFIPTGHRSFGLRQSNFLLVAKSARPVVTVSLTEVKTSDVFMVVYRSQKHETASNLAYKVRGRFMFCDL
jgi:hypothetical protein